MNIAKLINDAFEETDKDYIVFGVIKKKAGFNINLDEFNKALASIDKTWKTMVVSEHGFKPEYQAKYKAEAEYNIPLIYFGEGGFENHDVRGGCAYVICR